MATPSVIFSPQKPLRETTEAPWWTGHVRRVLDKALVDIVVQQGHVASEPTAWQSWRHVESPRQGDYLEPCHVATPLKGEIWLFKSSTNECFPKKMPDFYHAEVDHWNIHHLPQVQHFLLQFDILSTRG